MSGAQVMMTVPNFYKLETSRYDLSYYNDMIDKPLNIKNGDLYLDESPGLGINLNEEYLIANEMDINRPIEYDPSTD